MGLRSRASKRAEADAAAIKRAQSDPVTIEERADASESVKGAMIDNKSMADYRKQFENHRLKNRHATGKLVRSGNSSIDHCQCCRCDLSHSCC